MSIALFKTLIAVAERGSFAAAADVVNVSHAAVGQQMKRLEDLLNVALFDRSQRIPQLNQTGRDLVQKAKDIVHDYENILGKLDGDAASHGQLVLGAISSTIPVMVPEAVKRLVTKNPNLLVHVVTGLSGELIDQVERGALDAAIIGYQQRAGGNMNWRSLAKEEMVLLVSPEVTEDDPIKLLRELPYIRHTRRGAVGALSDEWLAHNGITVRVSMEMESLTFVAYMVSYNLGVSVVPDLCVPDSVFAGLRKIPLEQNPVSRELGILTRNDCSKQKLVDQIAVELSEIISSHGSTSIGNRSN